MYPATDQSAAPGQEESLAHTVLRQMGRPTEPGTCEDDAVAIAPSEVKGLATTSAESAADDVNEGNNLA